MEAGNRINYTGLMSNNTEQDDIIVKMKSVQKNLLISSFPYTNEAKKIKGAISKRKGKKTQMEVHRHKVDCLRLKSSPPSDAVEGFSPHLPPCCQDYISKMCPDLSKKSNMSRIKDMSSSRKGKVTLTDVRTDD